MDEFEHACSIAESLRRTLATSELADIRGDGSSAQDSEPTSTSPPPPPPPPPATTVSYRQSISLDELSRPQMIVPGGINPMRVWTTLTPSYQPEVRIIYNLSLFNRRGTLSRLSDTILLFTIHKVPKSLFHGDFLSQSSNPGAHYTYRHRKNTETRRRC